jgi:hypothetical protein
LKVGAAAETESFGSTTLLIRYRTDQVRYLPYRTPQMPSISDTEVIGNRTYQILNLLVVIVSWEGERGQGLTCLVPSFATGCTGRGLDVILGWRGGGGRRLGMTCLVPNFTKSVLGGVGSHCVSWEGEGTGVDLLNC